MFVRRYAANAVSPGVIYSSPKQDPPYYFEGNPMNVRYSSHEKAPHRCVAPVHRHREVIE